MRGDKYIEFDFKIINMFTTRSIEHGLVGRLSHKGILPTIFSEANMTEIMINVGSNFLVEDLHKLNIQGLAFTIHNKIDKNSNNSHSLPSILIQRMNIKFKLPTWYDLLLC